MWQLLARLGAAAKARAAAIASKAVQGVKAFGKEAAEDAGIDQIGAQIQERLTQFFGKRETGVPPELRDNPSTPEVLEEIRARKAAENEPQPTNVPLPQPGNSLDAWKAFTNTVPPPPLPPPPTPPEEEQPLTSQQLRKQLGQYGLLQMLPSSMTQTGIMAGMATGNPFATGVGAGVGIAGDTTKYLIELPKRLKDFGDSLLETRRPIGEFNASIGSAFARLESERIQRTQQLGVKTAGTTEGLTRSQSRLENALLPTQAIGVNAMNRLTELLQNAAASAVELFNRSPIMTVLRTAANHYLGGDDGKFDALLNVAIKEIGRRDLDWDGRRREPPKPPKKAGKP